MPTKSEIRNRRIVAVIIVLAAVFGILLVADVGPFADETEEDRVRDAVEEFIAARDDREFETVCDLLTVPLKREVQATSGAQPGTKPPSCAKVLQAQAEAGPKQRGGEGGEVVDVSVSGNRARASVERSEGISQSIALELVEERWLVSSFER
jgi:hypothetical protein